jgi:hypothetical protein
MGCRSQRVTQELVKWMADYCGWDEPSFSTGMITDWFNYKHPAHS